MTLLPWHTALAYALLGTELNLVLTPHPDIPGLVAELNAAGWPRERVTSSARDAWRGQAWPHPVPAGLRAGLGAAQLAGALREARAAYGLVSLDVRAPSARTTLTADERRLLADRPPHHGG